MKKTYINPSIKVVNSATEDLLVTSDPKVSIKGGSVNAENVGSRRGSYWDDEESE